MYKTPLISFLYILATLAGCASTPDPEEICTTKWVSERTDRAVVELLDETVDAVKAIQKVAAIYVDGKKPNMFQMLSLSNALKDVEKELTKGRGIKDLKTVARTCNDPELFIKGFSQYVDQIGLPDRLRAFMEGLPEYRALLQKHLDEITQ